MSMNYHSVCGVCGSYVNDYVKVSTLFVYCQVKPI